MNGPASAAALEGSIEPLAKLLLEICCILQPHSAASISGPASRWASPPQRALSIYDLAAHLEASTTFENFFADADLNPAATPITGSICGGRIEEIDDPLIRRIRCFDKLVDELATGRPLERALRL